MVSALSCTKAGQEGQNKDQKDQKVSSQARSPRCILYMYIVKQKFYDESESSDENANNNAMNKEDGSTSPMSIDSDL